MKIATKKNEKKDTIEMSIDFEDCNSIEETIQHLVAINEVALGKVCEAAADEIMSKEFLTRVAYTKLSEVIIDMAAAIQLPQEKIDG